MALEKETVALIASSCVLIFLLTIGLVIFAYIFYRRLERNKLSRLPKYGPRDVSAWATDVSSTMVTDIDAEVDNRSRLHAYRPKMLAHPMESDRRHIKPRANRIKDSRQNNVTQVVENGRVLSVINVTSKPQDTDHESIANDHTVVRPNGLYVYGHPSRLESEGEIQREHVVHESGGKIVDGYMIEEDLRDQNVHQVTIEERSVLHKQHPHVHASADLPELVKGHIVKQTVAVGEDGHLVVTSSRHLDLNESTGFSVAHHDGPITVYGHRSTHKDFEPLDAGHPAQIAKTDQFTTTTHLALEGIAATGVSVSVPHIIVSHLEEPKSPGQVNKDSSDDEDDEEHDRKRRENYKVIKKHSAYKVPDWVIKKVTEQETNIDPEIKDTVVHLEQRIGTGHEPHRESVSEIERRLSHFSAPAQTHSTPVSPEAPSRRTAVTFGEVTHIQDTEILFGGNADPGDPDRRFSNVSVGPVVEDYLDVGTSTLQTYTFPDGSTASVVTRATALSDVTHVLEIDNTRTSPLMAGHS